MNKMNSISIPEDHCLTSLDVASLFTIASTALIEKAIIKRCQAIRKYSDVPASELLKAIDLVMNNTYF